MRRITLSAGVRAARDLRAHSNRLGLEILEDRLLPSAGLANVAVPDIVLVNSDAAPMTGSGLPAGFSPQQISEAYGFNDISFDNGAIQGNGSGQTIVIVDAYNQPNITSDLATFDSMYGLAAPPSFKVVNQSGGNTLPSSNQQWGLEESLDVEWAHAMAPGANIVLVEANSNSFSDLMTAVNYASNYPGASVVSMSWASTEFADETEYDSDFTTPSGHQGVTFVASSGDSGIVEYPSVSPNVLTVGGTQLTTNSAGDYEGETAWSDSGGGISTYESQPSYQKGVVTQTSTNRAAPDVSYNASPSTPYAVYDSSDGGWLDVGGTSAGAPQWAALIAIADQGRALDGEGTLNGATQTLPALYQLPQSDFHDVTSGSNGTYSAGTGYDLVTGRGSPIANLVVAGLVSYGTSSESPPVLAEAITLTSSTATTANFSVLGSDGSGTATLTYTWSVVSEPSGAEQPTFSINGTNAAQNTTATFYDAGAYTFQVAITNVYGQSVSSSVNVTVSQVATGLTLTPTNGSVNDNGTLQFTATATDQFGHAMNAQPSWNWSLSGSGSLSNSGLYAAPGSGNGTAVVYVSGDGLTQSVDVTFQAAASSSPGQSWSAWLQLLDTWFAELSQMQSMWQLLLGSGSTS